VLCLCSCRAPASLGVGFVFDVVVSVHGVSSAFQGPRWSYAPPEVLLVSPGELPPGPPNASTTFTVRGRNFGYVPGTVTVGARTLVCGTWTDALITCAPPLGVAAAARVVVTAASTRSSGDRGVPAPTIRFMEPVVADVQPVVSGVGLMGDAFVDGTRGGRVLRVMGAAFGLPLPVTLWLVRQGGVPGPPWLDSAGQASTGGPTVVRCPTVPGAPQSTTTLLCVWPPGVGGGWQVVVVNHELATLEDPGTSTTPPGSPSLTTWQASTPSAARLQYRAPAVTSVRSGGPAVAVGGFPLLIYGTDLSALPGAVAVTVGHLPCPVLVESVTHDSVTHEGLVCTAPPRQVEDTSDVVVVVGGQWSAAYPFAYEAPVVHRVLPSVLDAPASPARPRVTLRGRNFGSRYRDDVPTNHTVRLGPGACGDVAWASDSELSCRLEGDFVVGWYSLVLVVGGAPTATAPASAASVQIEVSCPPGSFGQPGRLCSQCVPHAQCLGRGSDPVSLPGFYPLALAEFVPCIPGSACVGGVSAAQVGNSTSGASSGCARNYRGVRCSTCGSGAYRLKGRCVPCPNTAWLLFLSFSLAILGAVAGAVYLSKKRINMAGLSVGVVRSRSCWACPCSIVAPCYTTKFLVSPAHHPLHLPRGYRHAKSDVAIH
jgi:hypothetical protein